MVSYSIPTQDHGSSYCVQLGVLNGNQQTAAEHVANKVHATTPVAAVAGSGRKEGQKSERASWYWQGSGCEDHPSDVAAGINCPRNLPAAGGTGCVAIATLVVEPVETAAVAAGVAAVGNAGSARYLWAMTTRAAGRQVAEPAVWLAEQPGLVAESERAEALVAEQPMGLLGWPELAMPWRVLPWGLLRWVPWDC